MNILEVSQSRSRRAPIGRSTFLLGPLAMENATILMVRWESAGHWCRIRDVSDPETPEGLPFSTGLEQPRGEGA